MEGQKKQQKDDHGQVIDIYVKKLCLEVSKKRKIESNDVKCLKYEW